MLYVMPRQRTPKAVKALLDLDKVELKEGSLTNFKDSVRSENFPQFMKTYETWAPICGILIPSLRIK